MTKQEALELGREAKVIDNIEDDLKMLDDCKEVKDFSAFTEFLLQEEYDELIGMIRLYTRAHLEARMKLLTEKISKVSINERP